MQNDKRPSATSGLETLADNIPDIIFRIDRGFRHVYVNKAIYGITGLPPDNFIGKTNRELGMPFDKCLLWETKFAETFAAKTVVEFDFEFTSLSGTRYFHTRLIPETNADGSVDTILGIANDITAYRRTVQELSKKEDELRERVEELERLMNLLPLGVFIAHDPECRRITGNRAGYELLNLPEGSNLSATPGTDKKSPFADVRRDGKPLQPAELPMQKSAREGSELRNVEFELVYPDNTAHTLFGSASPLYDSSGQVRGSVAAFVDITSRKQAEQALRESQDRLHRILESITDAFVSFDANWCYNYVNAEAERQTGKTRGELLGKRVWDVFPELVGTHIERALRQCVETKTTCNFEGQGEGRTIECRAFPTLEGGVAVYFSDVTEKREIDRVLKESEARFKLALRNDAVIIYEQDAQLRYTWLYPRMTEAVGHTDHELTSKEDADRLTTLKRSVLETGNPIRDIVAAHVGDRVTYYDLVIEPRRDENGNIIGICGAALDVTQRKLAEEALRDSETRLQEADRRKNEFIAMLAHELRNPLGPIRNSAYILQQLAPNDNEVQRVRSTIERQAAHMGRIVDDLLDVSRVTRGKIILNKEVIDARLIAQEVAQDYEYESRRAEIRIEVRSPDAPTWVVADRTRLAQCIGNLLHNAIKFSPHGARVVVEIAARERLVVIVVQDHGAGVEPHLMKKLFEPFVQAQQPLDRTRGGLGLGLALVKQLVALHEGRVWAESAGIGKGTRVTIELPVTEPPVHKKATLKPQSNTRRRVLIIEDNEDAADTLGILLLRDGHEARAVYSGEAALKLLDTWAPDIILCDIGLPGFDGYEVCRRVQARGNQNVIMVALTGYGQDEDVQKAIDTGFERHLTKPVDPETLVNLVRTVGS